jgi:2-keto-4-pentenoate hydratase
LFAFPGATVVKELEFDEAAVIERFWAGRQSGDYFPSEWENRLTLDQAYRIQLGVIARRVALGERQVGWKVGLTAAAIQRQFGFHHPVFGCLLEEGRKRSGLVFACDALIKPGFETELCMQLREPLAGTVDAARARRAIGHCFPALEIVETRGDALAQTMLLVADNAQQKAFVLGEPVMLTDDLMLPQVEARVTVNGAEVARGFGEAVLDDPVNSVVWLAGKLGELGLGIAAGDMIMTGSFVRQFPLAPGDRVRAEFTGIGAVEVGLGS